MADDARLTPPPIGTATSTTSPNDVGTLYLDGNGEHLIVGYEGTQPESGYDWIGLFGIDASNKSWTRGNWDWATNTKTKVCRYVSAGWWVARYLKWEAGGLLSRGEYVVVKETPPLYLPFYRYDQANVFESGLEKGDPDGSSAYRMRLWWEEESTSEGRFKFQFDGDPPKNSWVGLFSANDRSIHSPLWRSDVSDLEIDYVRDEGPGFSTTVVYQSKQLLSTPDADDPQGILRYCTKDTRSWIWAEQYIGRYTKRVEG